MVEGTGVMGVTDVMEGAGAMEGTGVWLRPGHSLLYSESGAAR